MNKKHKYKYNIVILGAGKSNDENGHSSLKLVQSDLNTLDWLIHLYSDLNTKYYFIGGYQIDQIKSKYLNFNFIINNNWLKTGAAGSLLLMDTIEQNEHIVTYSDILYRNDTINKLIKSNSRITIIIDSLWKKRYLGRSIHDLKKSEKVSIINNSIVRLGADIDLEIASAEFIGLVKFGKGVLNKIKSEIESDSKYLKTGNLSRLIDWARINGEKIDFIDIKGDWAELDDPKDLAHFILGTKAETLNRLKPVLKNSIILDQFTFTVSDWNTNQKLIVSQITKTFKEKSVVIRSSAINEDSFASANAGVYESILNVPKNQKTILSKSINEVINSYGNTNIEDQVLVQPMLKDVKISGVLFTRTLSDGAPYYVINYDDITGETDTITSGKGSFQKIMLIRRDEIRMNKIDISDEINRVLVSSIEVETILNYDSLDIEFALTNKNEVVIMQVRPMVFNDSINEIPDEEIFETIKDAEHKYSQGSSRSSFILGKRQIFGIMPDWNPAEIIGIKPNQLSISLYKYLIMDSTWAQQRFEYGYRDLRNHNLMKIFAGHPYVDVVASINSFIPYNLDDYLAEKFINFHSDFLINNPDFHDKIEFEIIPTCIDFNFQKWENRFSESKIFSVEEIEQLKNSLLKITNNALDRIDYDYDKLIVLQKRYEVISGSDQDDLQKARLLLDDCKYYGALPFAHLARAAFIAMSFLKSAVSKSIINEDCYADFLRSINSISHDFQIDAKKVVNNKKSLDSFISKYGHIRPGTYDINIKSYKEDPNYYIDPILNKKQKKTKKEISGIAWNKVKLKFDLELNAIGVKSQNIDIENFMRKAITGREYAKFLFTRNLSSAMDLFIKFGKKNGLNRDKISNLTIDDLFHMQNFSIKDADFNFLLNRNSIDNSNRRKVHQKIELPPLICSENDFKYFLYPSSRPNYISKSRVIAEKVLIDKNTKSEVDLKGKIVLIPQADPGYDWLFGQDISGLITIYGGANSHMAIRSAEFGIPAAIGIGNIEYKRIEMAQSLCLDSIKEKIDIIEL